MAWTFYRIYSFAGEQVNFMTQLRVLAHLPDKLPPGNVNY